MGRAAELGTTEDQWSHRIHCSDCGANNENGHPTAAQAFIAWNRRATLHPDPLIQEAVEALEPFERFASRFSDTARDDDWQLTRNPSGRGNLTMGDCRRARSAHTKLKAILEGGSNAT